MIREEATFSIVAIPVPDGLPTLGCSPRARGRLAPVARRSAPSGGQNGGRWFAGVIDSHIIVTEVTP